MKLFATIATAIVVALLAIGSAVADDAPPDDATPITLTYGELKALIAANVANAQFQPVYAQFQRAQQAAHEATEKLLAQLAPKKPEPAKPDNPTNP